MHLQSCILRQQHAAFQVARPTLFFLFMNCINDTGCASRANLVEVAFYNIGMKKG